MRNGKDIKDCLDAAHKLKEFGPEHGGIPWTINEQMIVTMAEEIERLRLEKAPKVGGKKAKLTARARKDIAQAINAMMTARESWMDAVHLDLPKEVTKPKQDAFNERRRELDALLDKHSEQ